MAKSVYAIYENKISLNSCAVLNRAFVVRCLDFFSFLTFPLSHVIFVCRMLIIENFIPPEEKTKIQNRASYDEDEDTWQLRALANKK